jgi:hypothetical protein
LPVKAASELERARPLGAGLAPRDDAIAVDPVGTSAQVAGTVCGGMFLPPHGV